MPAVYISYSPAGHSWVLQGPVGVAVSIVLPEFWKANFPTTRIPIPYRILDLASDTAVTMAALFKRR
jgi:hypothetical protein